MENLEFEYRLLKSQCFLRLLWLSVGEHSMDICFRKSHWNESTLIEFKWCMTCLMGHYAYASEQGWPYQLLIT